jgi:hypothetical protein
MALKNLISAKLRGGDPARFLYILSRGDVLGTNSGAHHSNHLRTSQTGFHHPRLNLSPLRHHPSNPYA